jgi:hypothetical protein
LQNSSIFLIFTVFVSFHSLGNTICDSSWYVYMRFRVIWITRRFCCKFTQINSSIFFLFSQSLFPFIGQHGTRATWYVIVHDTYICVIWTREKVLLQIIYANLRKILQFTIFVSFHWATRATLYVIVHDTYICVIWTREKVLLQIIYANLRKILQLFLIFTIFVSFSFIGRYTCMWTTYVHI